MQIGRIAQAHPPQPWVKPSNSTLLNHQREPLTQLVEFLQVGIGLALAYLAGTWLGSEQRTYRLFTKETDLCQEQADAVSYLGSQEDLTASRADPAIYLGGPYREQLQRLSRAATHLMGQPVDLVEEGLHLAQAGPFFFEHQGPKQ